MKIERTSNAVVTVRFDNVAAGWEHWVLLRSDAHHDSTKCNRKLEKKHLDEMVAKGGSWASFGDLFDAMQGKYDPRRNYDEVRPEDAGENYYDRIVNHAEDFYNPYAERCLLLAPGNHETAALKHGSTNLTERLVKALNKHLDKEGSVHRINLGGYGGWIRFVFTVHSTKGQQLKLRYFHGGGGSAPVTKGVTHTARQAVFLSLIHI